MGRFLVIAGLATAAIGLLMMAGLPFGRLPGDITIRRGGATVHVPLVTSIILSVILTVLLSVFRR